MDRDLLVATPSYHKGCVRKIKFITQCSDVCPRISVDMPLLPDEASPQNIEAVDYNDHDRNDKSVHLKACNGYGCQGLQHELVL